MTSKSWLVRCVASALPVCGLLEAICHRVKINKSHNMAFSYISYHNPVTHLFILSTENSAFYPRSYVCKARETICGNAPPGMRVLQFNCQIACPKREKLLPQCVTKHAHSALLINDDTNCMLYHQMPICTGRSHISRCIRKNHLQVHVLPYYLGLVILYFTGMFTLFLALNISCKYVIIVVICLIR